MEYPVILDEPHMIAEAHGINSSALEKLMHTQPVNDR
jgi:hypothetical protein